MHNEGKFEWTDGSGWTFAAWNNHEPNDWGHGEDCAEKVNNGGWNDLPCDHKRKFMCSMPVGTMSRETASPPPPSPPPLAPTWVDYPDVVCKDYHIEEGENPNHDGKFTRTKLPAESCSLEGCKQYAEETVDENMLFAIEFKAKNCQCDTFTDKVTHFKYKGKPGVFTCAVNTLVAGDEELEEYDPNTVPKDGTCTATLQANTNGGEDLRGCISTGGEDIRGQQDKMDLCIEECCAEPGCVGVVFHPWGSMLKSDTEGFHVRGGFQWYHVTGSSSSAGGAKPFTVYNSVAAIGVVGAIAVVGVFGLIVYKRKTKFSSYYKEVTAEDASAAAASEKVALSATPAV